MRVPVLDDVVVHPLPAVCVASGTVPPAEDAKFSGERRQVFDLSSIRFEVSEHYVLELQCACGKLHRNQFPDLSRIRSPTGRRSRALQCILRRLSGCLNAELGFEGGESLPQGYPRATASGILNVRQPPQALRQARMYRSVLRCRTKLLTM